MSEHDALPIRTEASLTGETVRLVMTVDLPPGVHIEPHQPTEPHLIPTELDVDGLDDLAVTYPAATTKDLGWKDAALTVLEGTLEFVVTGRVKGDLTVVRGTLRFQPCVGGACLPPRSVSWECPVAGTSAFSVLHGLAPAHPALVP